LDLALRFVALREIFPHPQGGVRHEKFVFAGAIESKVKTPIFLTAMCA
jgi:hypothetical protein